MPKVNLCFTLPEEQEDYQLAINGSKWQTIVYELDTWLRNKYKYENIKWAGEVRDELYKLLDEYGVRLDG